MNRSIPSPHRNFLQVTDIKCVNAETKGGVRQYRKETATPLGILLDTPSRAAVIQQLVRHTENEPLTKQELAANSQVSTQVIGEQARLLSRMGILTEAGGSIQKRYQTSDPGIVDAINSCEQTLRTCTEEAFNKDNRWPLFELYSNRPRWYLTETALTVANADYSYNPLLKTELSRLTGAGENGIRTAITDYIRFGIYSEVAVGEHDRYAIESDSTALEALQQANRRILKTLEW